MHCVLFCFSVCRFPSQWPTVARCPMCLSGLCFSRCTKSAQPVQHVCGMIRVLFLSLLLLTMHLGVASHIFLEANGSNMPSFTALLKPHADVQRTIEYACTPTASDNGHAGPAPSTAPQRHVTKNNSHQPCSSDILGTFFDQCESSPPNFTTLDFNQRISGQTATFMHTSCLCKVIPVEEQPRHMKIIHKSLLRCLFCPVCQFASFVRVCVSVRECA